MWIEIGGLVGYTARVPESHPSRVCGLKYESAEEIRLHIVVTPLAGVWIEIHQGSRGLTSHPVTPLAGVWIEISQYPQGFDVIRWSHPSRVCGLK